MATRDSTAPIRKPNETSSGSKAKVRKGWKIEAAIQKANATFGKTLKKLAG